MAGSEQKRASAKAGPGPDPPAKYDIFLRLHPALYPKSKRSTIAMTIAQRKLILGVAGELPRSIHRRPEMGEHRKCGGGCKRGEQGEG